MKRYWPIIAALATVVACSGEDALIEEKLSEMTLREKLGQMFYIRPEALDPTIVYATSNDLPEFKLQAVNERMKATAAEYPMGGVVLFGHNILDPAQLTQFIKDLRDLPGDPLICVDEEGGRVARVANNPAFGVPKFENMGRVAASGRTRDVADAAFAIGSYLHSFGFNLDFAPVADVNTNPENVVIGERAFSSDPATAASMVKAYLKGLRKAGVAGCLKHFPGHGDTKADSHFGYAMSAKTWEEIDACEMIPFKAGIRAGVPMVMTAHISLPSVTGTDIPSTLSPLILQEKLRGELGFKGVIITDAMEMGAITMQYKTEEACVLAILAGCDILLCVHEYGRAFEAVLSAVQDGTIPESRIDESVRRILHLKKLQKSL